MQVELSPVIIISAPITPIISQFYRSKYKSVLKMEISVNVIGELPEIYT